MWCHRRNSRNWHDQQVTHKNTMPSIAVVGAGVVGLTTATLLQDALPGTPVTLLADKFLQDTTSDGAAGIYRPGLQFQGPSPEVTRRWLEDSYKYFKDILHSGEPEVTGVKTVSGFHFSSQYSNIVFNPFLKMILEEYRPCTQDELDFYGYKYGTFMTTILTECRRFLPYLTEKFKSRGGVVLERRLQSLEELAGDFDVACNCSGFGARDLCGDLSVTPIRGQVFKVRAPWVKHFYYVDYDTYILPGFDLLTLGGTRQFDSYSSEVCRHDAAAIWERCTQVLPSLRNGEVVRQWVGWRPYRPSVRVERETMTFPSKKTLEVVHNYGHGGYGVMTAPGTSINAVKLVVDYLASRKAKL